MTPIDARHTAVGRPSAITHTDTGLSVRQKKLLDSLPYYGIQCIVKKSTVSMKDLASLTASEGVEFALFTKGGERLVVRGNYKKVPISASKAKKIAAGGWRWSGHTHVGVLEIDLVPSDGDRKILACFPQSNSVICNSTGRYYVFGFNEVL